MCHASKPYYSQSCNVDGCPGYKDEIVHAISHYANESPVITRYLTRDWLLLLPDDAKCLVEEYLLRKNTTIEQVAGRIEAGQPLDEIGIWACAKRTRVNVTIHHAQGTWTSTSGASHHNPVQALMLSGDGGLYGK